MTATAKTMQGQLCLVTGANSGIGKVTALELARRGAHVVMVCRDPDRGAAAQSEIQAQTSSAAVDLLLADLSSQQAIRDLAATIHDRYPHLHVLVNNAGALYLTRRETVDGMEMTLAVNYLAPFLLTHLLRGLLEASAPARIVTVSSNAHLSAQLRLDDLQSRRYGPMRAYGQAKYAVTMWTYALARRLAGTGVTANCLHPGFVASDFAQRGHPAPIRALARFFMHRAGISPAKGAQTSIYLASDPAVADVTGQYFTDCQPAQSAPGTYDQALQERLWAATLPLVGLPADDGR